jgi:hypothetical protein
VPRCTGPLLAHSGGKLFDRFLVRYQTIADINAAYDVGPQGDRIVCAEGAADVGGPCSVFVVPIQ